MSMNIYAQVIIDFLNALRKTMSYPTAQQCELFQLSIVGLNIEAEKADVFARRVLLLRNKLHTIYFVGLSIQDHSNAKQCVIQFCREELDRCIPEDGLDVALQDVISKVRR